jgi:hypothetical protein
MKLLGVVAEAIDVAVAGWKVAVELVTNHSYKRGIEESLDVEER